MLFTESFRGFIELAFLFTSLPSVSSSIDPCNRYDFFMQKSIVSEGSVFLFSLPLLLDSSCCLCSFDIVISYIATFFFFLQAMQPLQQRIEVCFQQMRAHVESKYGRRDVDPQLERQMAQLMRNQHLSQRVSGNSSTATSSFNNGLLSADGANSPHQRISGDAVDSPSTSNTSSLTPSRMSTLSAGQSGASHQHQSSQRQTNLFSRSTSQTLSSLSFSSLTGGSSPSGGNGISPVKMLSTGNRFRTGVKSSEKKLRDKENKQHRDSFRRLSSSSVGRGSPFPSLSLAGFSLGGSASSSGPSSPVVTGANTPVLGSYSIYHISYHVLISYSEEGV